MRNDAKYVVTTHWGTFSLDEASYRDYLTGNHWICFSPGKPAPPQMNTTAYAPCNVTDRAVALREQADRDGVLAVLSRLGIREIPVPYRNRLAELSIDEMNLTARSSNGLKRSAIHTFGALREILAVENGLQNIRNIGLKSVREIKQQFFTECYNRLHPYEKAGYWQEVIDICK